MSIMCGLSAVLRKCGGILGSPCDQGGAAIRQRAGTHLLFEVETEKPANDAALRRFHMPAGVQGSARPLRVGAVRSRWYRVWGRVCFGRIRRTRQFDADHR